MLVYCTECGWEGEDTHLESSPNGGSLAIYCPCCGSDDVEDDPVDIDLDTFWPDADDY